jgi:hypothetical protein
VPVDGSTHGHGFEPKKLGFVVRKHVFAMESSSITSSPDRTVEELAK